MDRSGRSGQQSGARSGPPQPPRLHVIGPSGHQRIVVPTSGVLASASAGGEIGDLSRITFEEGKEIMETYNILKGRNFLYLALF